VGVEGEVEGRWEHDAGGEETEGVFIHADQGESALTLGDDEEIAGRGVGQAVDLLEVQVAGVDAPYLAKVTTRSDRGYRRWPGDEACRDQGDKQKQVTTSNFFHGFSFLLTGISGLLFCRPEVGKVAGMSIRLLTPDLILAKPCSAWNLPYLFDCRANIAPVSPAPCGAILPITISYCSSESIMTVKIRGITH
jgi:hypothetical protein